MQNLHERKQTRRILSFFVPKSLLSPQPEVGQPRISYISKFLPVLSSTNWLSDSVWSCAACCTPMLDGALHLPPLNRCSQNAYYKAAAKTRPLRYLMPIGKRYRSELKQFFAALHYLRASAKRCYGSLYVQRFGVQQAAQVQT